jgi:YHS domain-containing protein
MKKLKPLIVGSLLAAFCLTAITALAGDQPEKPKLKPYTLKVCVVSGDKLGEMGDPFVYEYEGREIKFCCKGCVKDFKKDPAKYLKKIEQAEAKAKKAKS